MKHLKKILVVLLITLTAIACKNDKNKTNRENSDIEETLKEEKSIQKDKKIVFQKILNLQNISFDIKTTGEGSFSQLSIQPKDLEIENQNVSLEIDGQVVNAEIEDLNSDGFPEILIYTISAGSGSYGNVIGYSVNNGKSLSQIYFPEISENKEASSGYMGHDEFAIIETTLARRFPVYKDGDTNNNPTGGTRQIEYKLKDGEASRLFVLDKISEY
ncbi:PliI family lysozyme inhibitor of I-type lysozyme [Maribacter arcticus]|uniref:PliI family lysozyme inhibitor of I-type lysozyme n=1 Tax=Maribacter arcticus TaxID=561365 RepID=UPI003002D987